MSGTSSNAKYGKAKSRKSTRDRQEWQGYIDIALTEEDRVQIGTGELEPADFVGLLEELTTTGYKVSFSPDAAHQCVICTATGVGDECLNAGYSLSARGPDLSGALAVLWHKHGIMAQGGLWANVGGTSVPSRFA